MSATVTQILNALGAQSKTLQAEDLQAFNTCSISSDDLISYAQGRIRLGDAASNCNLSANAKSYLNQQDPSKIFDCGACWAGCSFIKPFVGVDKCQSCYSSCGSNIGVNCTNILGGSPC